jgi:hypothetical protein
MATRRSPLVNDPAPVLAPHRFAPQRSEPQAGQSQPGARCAVPDLAQCGDELAGDDAVFSGELVDHAVGAGDAAGHINDLT